MDNAYYTLFLLCVINLINYMDRFTIAGVLSDIQKYFQINDSTAGLLQTAFIVSYMLFSPIFGHLGDRYSRKIIIIFGVTFWSLVTLLSSFVQPHHTYWFFLFRGLVGVGEASYATVAPTLIADFFNSGQRSLAVALFYFAIPVGSGLGYIVGIAMSKIFQHWTFALRFTPAIGLLAVFGFFFVKEPLRGACDNAQQTRRAQHNQNEPFKLRNVFKELKDDMKYLSSVSTFIMTTFGFTCVSFSIGALSWWAPKYMESAIQNSNESTVGITFGAIACFGGLIGVLIGYSASHFFRPSYPTADAWVCAIGVLISIPCMFIAILFARPTPLLSWISIFAAITFLSSNWSVVVDILLYVIEPSRRATAQSIQILISHILGDAFSPFLVGMISDNFQKRKIEVYFSMMYSLCLCPIILVLGGVFFIWSSRYLISDEIRCKRLIAGSDSALSQSIDDADQRTVNESTSTNNLIQNQNLVQRSVDSAGGYQETI